MTVANEDLPKPRASGAPAAVTPEGESARRSSGGARLLRGGAGLIGTLLGLLALPVVFRIPSSAVWELTVAVSVWTHLLVGACLLAAALSFVVRRRTGSPGAKMLAIFLFFAAIISAIPVGEQRLSVARLADDLREQFGEGELRTYPGAPPRSAALSPAGWWAPNAPRVAVTTHRFATVSEIDLELDLYRAEGATGPQPLIVVVHGGAWVRGERSDFPDWNRYFAARGYTVADVDYRLAPTHRFPAAIDDIHRAIDALRERADEWGIDRDRIVLLGRSAGGHLALTAAYRAGDRPIAGVVGFYAPTDLVWSWETSIDKTYIDGRAVIEALMGGVPADLPELYREASPREWVSADTPPTLLLHGDRDVLVAPHQSTRLAEKLTEFEVPHLEIQIPGATHGFDISLAGGPGQIGLFAVERFLAAVCR